MAPIKQADPLRIGVLGAGPISQAAHFEACQKARNAELYAVCDLSPELLAHASAIYQPSVTFTDYAAMLADSNVDAVLIGAADQFHAALATNALQAGKHVLLEKPMTVSVEEAKQLQAAVATSGLVFQIGHNQRFDPGIWFAHRFMREELGPLMYYKGWYRDSTSRYTMTDNLQPLIQASTSAKRPEGNPKTDRGRYYLLTHGSHLVDLACWFSGPAATVEAKLLTRADAFCWFVDVDFESGALGHLELTVPIEGDFNEGFDIAGDGGSIQAKIPLTWYHKTSDVACFSTKDGLYRYPLGADAFSYRLQVESFADTVKQSLPQVGANAEEGLHTVQILAAISESVRQKRRVDVQSAQGPI